MLYEDSSDPKVAQTGVEVKTGRKWRANKAVLQSESHIRHRVLVGDSGKSWSGNLPNSPVFKGQEEGHGLISGSQTTVYQVPGPGSVRCPT